MFCSRTSLVICWYDSRSVADKLADTKNLAGSWQHRSSHDPLSAHSHTGFVIMYSGCPILWKISMQKLVALSTTEAEYIELSSALHEVIEIINLLEELKGQGFGIHAGTPNVK